jgi:hypothetical protein
MRVDAKAEKTFLMTSVANSADGDAESILRGLLSHGWCRR